MKKKKYLLIPLCLALCGSYLAVEDFALQMSYYDIVSDRLPLAFNNFKIAQISDFHNVKSELLTNQVLSKLRLENPDIIVITGDSVDANRPNINITLDFINEITDIAPIYYVTGNHEATSHSRYNILKPELENIGVFVLDNKVDILVKNGDCINVIGVNDPGMFHAKAINAEDLLNMEINQVKYDTGLFTILLSHRPDLFNVYVEHNFDLVFSGHAHGGQVRVPFIGGLYAPNQGYFPKYTAGVYQEKDTSMVVSRGIGNSTFPFRVNNRPELVIVTLKSE